MAYLNDYIVKKGTLKFDELPFNDLDATILSMVSLIDVENCIPYIGHGAIPFEKVMSKQSLLHGNSPFGFIISKALTRLLVNASKSPRFKSLPICDLMHIVDTKIETQSTFFSVLLPNETRVIICGGTDDTVIGWKEDFNLMRNGHAPCLKNSSDYIDKVGENAKRIIVAGHSKGGMESLYAASFCKKHIRDKIEKAYSFDGPGYCDEIANNKKVKKMLDKMTLVVPNGGIVGRLFSSPVSPIIVPSKYHGLNQHDPLSWEIDLDNNRYTVSPKGFTEQSEAMVRKINEILNQMNENDKDEFIQNLFLILNAGGAKTLTDVGTRPHRALIQYLKLPKVKRTMINSLILKLVNDKIIAKELVLGAITIPKTQ